VAYCLRTPGAPVTTSPPFHCSGSRITNWLSEPQPYVVLVVESSRKWPSTCRPAPAGGFVDALACSVSQSLTSLRPFSASVVADRSSWHSTRWRTAPGTCTASARSQAPPDVVASVTEAEAAAGSGRPVRATSSGAASRARAGRTGSSSGRRTSPHSFAAGPVDPCREAPLSRASGSRLGRCASRRDGGRAAQP
jgi:hypothetical protein